jgi:hypothetical protein
MCRYFRNRSYGRYLGIGCVACGRFFWKVPTSTSYEAPNIFLLAIRIT